MKSFSGMFSWLLLAAVLAVPSFLFYTWWTAKAGSDSAAQAPAQSVSTAAIFGVPQDAAPTVAAAAPPAEPDAPASYGAPVSGPGAAQDRTELSERTTFSTGTAGAGQPAGTGSYFNPRSDRDPTLTPGDYQKIRDEEARRLEAEMAQRSMQARKLRETGGETRIKLQGIVGNSMIINGEMRSVGDTVNGVKLLKLGPNYVIGEFKGRKFKKILQ